MNWVSVPQETIHSMGYEVRFKGMEEEESLSDHGFEPKSPSAIDFYDINELCDLPEEDSQVVHSSDSEDSNDPPHNTLEDPFSGREVSGVIIPDKPLAGVLPYKYQNIDVNLLFPEFRHDQVLRFLRLFGPGKKSMPDIWRSVRKRISEEKKKREAKKSSSGDVEKPVVKECDVESDEEIRFLQHKENPINLSIEDSSLGSKSVNNAWRFGPAKLWYDVADVPENAETYDYGFKLAEDDNEAVVSDDVPDESFLMVSQYEWENDVIWDGDEVKKDIEDNVYTRSKKAGWIPISLDRTVASYRNQLNFFSSQRHTSKIQSNTRTIAMRQFSDLNKKEISHSLFPEENEKLLYDKWEDDVIWDSEAMPRISYPKLVEPDKDVILEIPDDKPPDPEDPEPAKDKKDRKFRPVIKKPEEEEDSEMLDSSTSKTDFYNISNDEFYNPKMTQENALQINKGGTLLQHSIPALELQAPYFQTYLGPVKLKRFHRPTLKQYSHGPLSEVNFHGVKSLAKRIRQKEMQRQRELKESGGGEMFFMRKPSDLSGKDGDLVFFEFSEEHPPLMNQVGMASKIKNYYRRRPGKEASMPEYKYGELAYSHHSPFIGALQPGQSIQAYENHLFRSPIYEHSVEPTDFLIIRTRFKYLIREVETVYAVGQQLPLIEVPAPKSEKTSNFMRDFLMVYIYRLFWKSVDRPRKIRMETIKKAFPLLKEFTIRKRLNLCADFQRTGYDYKFWVLKNGFRLPTEDEIRLLVSPEQCCAYYSMLAAENRLKEAGYGDKFLLTADDENDIIQNKLDDEVKAAPWNTTQAFISAMKGKCLLEISGVADPTGCGEGFSYIKAPNKPQWSKDDKDAQNPAKKLVRGTDADLRRLSLSSAKKLLKGFNVSDKEIKNMTRWQVIDVVRTLSTEQAKMGDEGVTKYARGNLHSHAEYMRRYKDECQRVFDLQNRILSSKEVLSSDEDSSSEEDSDLEEMGKTIEDMLSNKKSMKELSHEHEEAERKELQKFMALGGSSDTKPADKTDEKTFEGKILKIYRTYRNHDGSTFVRVETVRKTEVIELYTKIRDSKDQEFITNYSLNEEQKEAFRRERRRIQDQLRRIKRNESKVSYKEPAKKKMKIENPQLFKVKCGACGAAGHMRTNRACPLFSSSPSLPPIQVAMTEEQEEAAEKAALEEQNLIKIDETKIIVSKQLIKHADEIRRKSLVLKIPKDAVAKAKRRSKGEYDDNFSDYLSMPKGIHRKRVDPVVSISVIFEKLISELKALPHTQPFWLPVSVKNAPNYHDIIKHPMDLLTMKDKSRQQKYKSREDFLKDMQQMLDNSDLYNGNHSFLSLTAHTMLDHCIKKFSEEEEKLMELEKAINPLLDSAQVAFSFLLETVITDELKSVPESWPFHKPVDKRTAKGYYTLVKNPMDLDSLIRNCKSHKYKNRASFLNDVELIHSNSVIFNGATSQFTKIARDIVNACQVSLEMYAEQFEKLESGIREMEAANPNSNHNNSPPRRLKLVVKPIVKHKPPSTLNGSADTDMYVDVESVEPKRPNILDSAMGCLKSENGDSNSSFTFPDLCYDSQPYSGPASPSFPTQSESLFNSNGVLHSGYSSPAHSEDPVQSYSNRLACDNICDDLMLSETDSSEDDLQAVDPL
ncbi:hypothetical protein JTE90_006664 [Oedothorax gibbosus]|uniref:Bromo domain-containing protein n=1 Tax=Oedothorax gibbosus TaxID=931172 RepID=A0AAV6V3S5_9ARAC|nr:hypothetical protein JTE90_006664 [Oedothorax gibbosus]